MTVFTRRLLLGLALGLALTLGACSSTSSSPTARPTATAAVVVTPADPQAPGSAGVAPVATSGREVVYAIQPGTARRQAAGDIVPMFPAEIRMTLGTKDILVIRNDDDVPVSIDGLLLDPGQKATQKYFTSGVFSLVCSTDYHKEQVKIVVEEAAR